MSTFWVNEEPDDQDEEDDALAPLPPKEESPKDDVFTEDELDETKLIGAFGIPASKPPPKNSGKSAQSRMRRASGAILPGAL